MANDVQEELGDFSNTMFGDGLKSCSISPLEGGLISDPEMCEICLNKLLVPRVLSCLHVFCEQCLDNKIIGEAGDAGKPETEITCPTCKQDTKVGPKKVASLPLDIIATNVIDVSDLSNLACTCCTTKEMAVSRCCTCQNLLCNNCNCAHQYMRCFENHKVVMLDELKVSGKKILIHKPLMCDIHPTEALVFFCATCQALNCNECSKMEHRSPMHHCDSITDAELRVKQELDSLLSEGKAKVEVLLQASVDFEASLSELAHQRSTAKDLINESYQSYKAVLERCRDQALDELNELYHDRELKLMDMSYRVNKDVSLVEDACKFTTRLLENGNTAEIMYLKKFVSTQLLNLINNTPKPDKTFSIEFESDFEKFEQTMKTVFGRFNTESSVKENLIPAPLNLNAPILTNGCASSLNNSSPMSLPASMQSSFDGELQSNLSGFSLSQSVLNHPESPPVAAPAVVNPISGFSRMAEYNLQQLANLAAEKVDGTESVMAIGHIHGPTNPSGAPSPTSSFTLAELLAGDPNAVNNAYQNLQALAELRLNSTVGRGATPPLDPASLTLANPLLNGFGSISASTSPILSTPEDILPENLHAVQSAPNPSVSAGMVRSTKPTPMQIRCKFGQLGPSKGQFNSPHGFCLGTEEDIIVADTNNHRIQVFEKTGNYKFQFGVPGKDEGQLWYPRKVAVMRSNGKYVVCDRGNERSRMQIFTKNGHFVKKIAIRYIDIVAGLAVTAQSEIVAVDSVSPTVFVISEVGELLRWFDCSDYMREPSDIAIHGKEYYVCDFKGHNVVVFSEQGDFLRRIGCENITNFPNGIDISDAGDVLIGDSHGNRFHVAVFARDGSLVTEFECPYVKVSRCCGLKITSEGYVVTLAKNNHHVLVLNTLYIL